MSDHRADTPTGFVDEADAYLDELEHRCQWYALCDHQAAGTVAHPALGDVPTCERCAEKHDLELVR